LSQNIWERRSSSLHRQKRRAQLVGSYLKREQVSRIVDIGCAEGYATSFISKPGRSVIGVERDIQYLRIAKEKVREVNFINATIECLPFKKESFDAICVLEVLEHLDLQTQKTGMKEVDRILKSRGVLIVSVPYKENIIETKCVHCGKDTPLYGHLHSLDEDHINTILPSSNFYLKSKYRLPNIQIVSCKIFFEPLPLSVWKVINNLLGYIRKGYWIVLKYTKA
jgi:ubiquinone/menaquinone biosynthesis C-methylase UbiE